MSRSGCFITFEGGEGSGKSLQVGLLTSYLEKRGLPFLRTREPGGTAFGQELRALLLRSDGPAREPIAELLLYLADRYQHLKESIEPALAKGWLVVSDRYHDATLAYQGHARGLGIERVDRISSSLGIRRPDLTLLLDLPVVPALERARLRNHAEASLFGRFETEAIEFHERVREGYLLLARQDPDRILVIDATGTPEAVFKEVLTALQDRELL